MSSMNNSKFLILPFLSILTSACGSNQSVQFEPGRQERGYIHVVRLAGKPYQMGLQHGEFLADGLAEAVEYMETDSLMSLAWSLAQSEGYVKEARDNAFEDVYDECRGMAEAAHLAGVPGWTLDKCLTLAYGDVLLANLGSMLGGCTEFSVAGEATTDGQLIHGRNLDFGYVSYMVNHPTVFVRKPKDKEAWIEIGFPGSVTPYSGINAAGMTIASNEIDNCSDVDREGKSHQQMMREMFQDFEHLDEAESFLKSQDHMSAEMFLLTDYRNSTAAVFEMSANHMAVRRMSDDGVLYMTNHFIDPDMAPLQKPYEDTDSSPLRLLRLSQLLEPDGKDTLYGKIDLQKAASVLRDTTNPITGEIYDSNVYDNNASIGTNGALHSMLFLPSQRTFYLAAGQTPVPPKPFIGFSLDELFGLDPEAVPNPAQID